MRSLSLARVGAVCALIMVVGFGAGIALSLVGGVEVLIPETGEQGLRWIDDAGDAGSVFFVGAWLQIFAGLFGMVTLVAFYDVLRGAGPVMVIAPIAGVVGLMLVTISHLVPVAMAYELAPAYAQASDATRTAVAVTSDTLASASALTNYVGNALGWGVAVPLYAFAILSTSALPRWIGWLGLVVAVLAGWLGLAAPAANIVAAVSSIGFLAFFVFMASMGIAILRRAPSASSVGR